MKNLKRRLSSLLVLAMLLSMLPVGTLAAEPQPPGEDQQFELADPAGEPEEEPLYVEVSGQKVYLEPVTISTFSTQPLEVKYYTLDLRGYFPEELKEFSVSDMLSKLAKRSGTTEEAVKDPSKVAAFKAEWEYYDENGEYVGNDYAILGENKTLNLSRDSWYGGSVNLELIVGTVDQLSQSNIRYRIYIQTSGFRNLLIPEAYSVDDSRQPIGIYDHYNTSYGNGTRFRMIIDPKTWQYGKEAYLGLTLNPAVAGSAGLDVEVYSGRYDTEVAIMEANPPIVTSQIMDQANLSTAGGYRADYSGNRNYNQLPQFTFLFRRDGKTVKILPISVEMREGHVSVSFDYDLYANASGSSPYRPSAAYSWRSDDDNNTQIFYLRDYPANGTYYYNLRVSNPDPAFTGNDVDCIKKAVLGLYDTADQIPADAADIKGQLFSDASRSGGGYGADYSSGVSFTVVDIEDKLYQFTVKTEEETETYLPPEADPLSKDTYFWMENALDANGSLKAYVMPYDSDTYYSNGFQTVFLLNQDDTPVADNSKIKPVFGTGSNVTVFAGHDKDGQTVSADKQTSSVTERSFENGKVIQYSAAAENSFHLKNYWVTFLTQQSGPKLFVNGTNVESLREEEHEGQGDLIPVRELFLTEGSEEASYYSRHEVFFANVGNQKLENLSVTLENAKNVALDEYWKIGDTKELAPFDSVHDQTYNNHVLVDNVGKIRLVPERDEGGYIKPGEISGTLVITATGQDPVRIKLKGIAGSPEIITDKIRDGVKYVHYSSLIQTNSMYSADAVSFTLGGGRLPNGMQLKPNGELYGVPTETGSFTFTATATMTFGDRTYTDSKEFTFTIAENTRDNVEAGNNDPAIGYPFENNQKIWDVDYTGENQEQIHLFDQDMVSQGPFNEFMNVYLDGRLLTLGQDYDAEEGSTRITVRAQTFQNAGNGEHTISAEFRTDKDTNGTMHRTAQNFSISGLPSSSSGSGGGGGSSSESGKYNVTMPKFAHGKVTADPKTARPGDVVRLTVTPDEGYKLGSIKVTQPRDKEVALTQDPDGTYTFRMPNGTASISAEFVPVDSGSQQPTQPTQPTRPTPAGTTPFVDMLETDWFYPAVAQVYEKGWMTGTAPDSFAPRSKTSRGMIVTILHKLEGNPEAEGSYFSDVPLNCYYTRAVSWAAEQGIISGYGDGRFGPDDSLTREQIVMILYSYAKYKGMDLSAQSSLEQFNDLDQLSSEAQQAMAWAHGVGLISGKGDGILDPVGPATRAEMAALLVRFVSLMENGQ